MLGLMTERPLRTIDILTFASEMHGDAWIASAAADGTVSRVTYREAAGRTAQLAAALVAMGIAPGDRVATLAFNSARHFELYYAITGIGAVCHTINPRLPQDQLRYIVDHAEDRAIFADPCFASLLAELLPALGRAVPVVYIGGPADIPDGAPEGDACDDIVGGHAQAFDWPDMPENTAAGLCYTSGTTGHPKGALYSHRSTVLHALSVSNAFRDCLREGQRVLPVVPLFHVNAWGLPFAAPLTGTSLVMPGPRLDGPSLFSLMDRENVTSGWGVPTVWQGLWDEIGRQGRLPNGLADITVGGSAAPPALIAAFEGRGVNVCHAWGMTEMSPVGTQSNQPAPRSDAEHAAQIARKAKQGRRLFGVEMKILGEDGTRLPHDGKTVGALYVRGNTVISGYYAAEPGTADIDADGWFGTGDIASIDADGYMSIADRTKDMIKSGGEWISSIDLENAAVSHPDLKICAVIAVAHPRWGERPLLVAVPEGEPPAKSDVLAWLAPQFAKWQLPDDVVYIAQMPLTATGKIAKRVLRQEFAGHVLPGAEVA